MPFLLMSTDVKIWLLCETEIKIKKEKYNVKSKSVIWFFGVWKQCFEKLKVKSEQKKEKYE